MAAALTSPATARLFPTESLLANAPSLPTNKLFAKYPSPVVRQM